MRVRSWNPPRADRRRARAEDSGSAEAANPSGPACAAVAGGLQEWVPGPEPGAFRARARSCLPTGAPRVRAGSLTAARRRRKSRAAQVSAAQVSAAPRSAGAAVRRGSRGRRVRPTCRTCCSRQAARYPQRRRPGLGDRLGLGNRLRSHARIRWFRNSDGWHDRRAREAFSLHRSRELRGGPDGDVHGRLDLRRLAGGRGIAAGSRCRRRRICRSDLLRGSRGLCRRGFGGRRRRWRRFGDRRGRRWLARRRES